MSVLFLFKVGVELCNLGAGIQIAIVIALTMAAPFALAAAHEDLRVGIVSIVSVFVRPALLNRECVRGRIGNRLLHGLVGAVLHLHARRDLYGTNAENFDALPVGSGVEGLLILRLLLFLKIGFFGISGGVRSARRGTSRAERKCATNGDDGAMIARDAEDWMSAMGASYVSCGVFLG